MRSLSLHFAIEALACGRTGQGLVDADLFAQTVNTPELAYEVQQGVAEKLGWYRTPTPQFWKTGGPSRKAVPTHARLPEGGVWNSPATSCQFFAMRGIEAEIALRLAVPVDAKRAAMLDRDSACELIDAMAVSIEVVDSRWSQGLQAPAFLKLADLQSHGALVLGDWVPFDPARNWSTQHCKVEIADALPLEFRGTHSLGDPAYALGAWLRHATQGGHVLPAGSVVTTGTWCGIVHAQPGDVVVVSFEGIGQTRVAFTA
jgi:2-keto-4-pentenoate hydratase